MKKHNAYNIVDQDGNILYHAVAHNFARVNGLAAEKGYDIEDLKIELERSNVRDEMGRPIPEYIDDARVK